MISPSNAVSEHCPPLPWALERQSSLTATILSVVSERARQDLKWGRGIGRFTDSPWLKLAILTEEVGEVSRELLEGGPDLESIDLARLRAELVQVAAVAVAWVERLSERHAKADTDPELEARLVARYRLEWRRNGGPE